MHGKKSFAIMTNRSPPNRAWLWMEDVRPKETTEEPRLSLVNLEPLSSLSSIQTGHQANNHRSPLFRDTIMASEHLEMKISSLQSTGSTLGKHEHIYKTEPITNQPISAKKSQGKRETEQSMLAYTHKMQEISSRKGAVTNEQQSVNAASPVTKATRKRWATLHKLRRQTLELKSVSDSHWNFGFYNRQQQQHNLGPRGKAIQRPKSEVHLTSVDNNNDTPRRPRSDSDGVIHNHSSVLHGKGYGSHVDMYPMTHGRLRGETNVLTLPDITDSVESFSMDSSVQIVPFPGIEVQAVSLKLHSTSEPLPKDGKNSPHKVPSKDRVYKLSSQSQHPVQVQNRKKAKKVLKHQDKRKGLLPRGTSKLAASTETVLSQKSSKTKQPAVSDERGKNSKSSDAMHKKTTKSTEECNNLSHESPTNVVSGNQDGAPNDIALGIKSVLRTSAKKGKHRNTVHFGPQMVREVTKIVYPWNTADNSGSSEDEDQRHSDEDVEEEELDINNESESDSEEDYIYSDEDDNVENDL